jgi:hypothetical protein
MAKVKQPFGEQRWVPWLSRLVEPGETVEVPDDELESWLAGGWHPVDRAARAAAKKLAQAAAPDGAGAAKVVDDADTFAADEDSVQSDEPGE